MSVRIELDHIAFEGLDYARRARVVAALEQELLQRFDSHTLTGGQLRCAGGSFHVAPDMAPELIARTIASELHFQAHVDAAMAGQLAPGQPSRGEP